MVEQLAEEGWPQLKITLSTFGLPGNGEDLHHASLPPPKLSLCHPVYRQLKYSGFCLASGCGR